MGDHLILQKVEFLYGHLFQIDLLNETKNKSNRVFIEKDELYAMLENAQNDASKTEQNKESEE